MNEQNFDYLSRQVKYTGFGDEHADDLKAKMNSGVPEFVVTHNQQMGNDDVAATLQFRKGNTSDLYFFNRYSLMVKAEQADPIKQTFFINPKQDNITLKEGYNLLSGRAVEKEYTPKEGEKYKAWLQLDINEIDTNGQYKVRQFHPNYGYDLEATLVKMPIKELATNEGTKRLLESLRRGNRQQVTYGPEGFQRKVFIEAAPQFKTIHMYDEAQKRLTYQLPVIDRRGIDRKEKSEVELPSENKKKESAKVNETKAPKPKKTKRKGQKL